MNNNEKLIIIYPQKRHGEGRERLDRVLDYALEGINAEIYEDMRTLWDDPLETIPQRSSKINALFSPFLFGKTA